jgi:phage terminase large subunit-like protein
LEIRNYVTEYANDVLNGRIVAGPHVRDSCRRHINDLKTGSERGLFFNISKANYAIEFFQEVLCLNGGEFEGVPFDPEPWQKFIIGSSFGWVKTDGFRRFRVCYVETSKGSGKSPLAGGIGMLGLVADNEPRAEIYAAATKKDQAMVLFRDAVAMVDLSPELSSRLTKSGIGEKVWNLAYLEAGSFFRPISADDGQSGPRPHVVLLDEVHEHKNANIIEMMRAGTKGRRQALIFMITNSGYDKNSVCWHYHDYAIKVASGQLLDDSFFSYVCALDENEDPFLDEDCWIKTNPSLGVTIQKEYLREQVTQAKGMPSKESIVRRLNFSQWVGAESPWISSDVWFSAQESYPVEKLRGRRCYGGLDLSSTTDLTSLVLVFEPVFDDPYWRLLPFFWLPDEGLKDKGDRDGVDYLSWVKDGYLETTPGKAINKLFVVHRLAEITSVYDLQFIGYDRWRIEDLRQSCIDEGVEVVLKDFGQGYKDMAPAVDYFEQLLLNGEIKHSANPCLTWCAANAVVISDPAGNRKLAKDKSTGRIDGVVATVMALGVTLNCEPEFNFDDFINNLMIA